MVQRENGEALKENFNEKEKKEKLEKEISAQLIKQISGGDKMQEKYILSKKKVIYSEKCCLFVLGIPAFT